MRPARDRPPPPTLLSLPKEAVSEESEGATDAAPPSPLKREETGLAVREMLKESYREFTGHALPDYMTNEQAKVELNKFIFQWDDVDDDEEEGEDGEKSPAHNMSLSTILVASKFARKLGKQTKARRARMPRNEEGPRRARAAQGELPRDHGLGDAQLDDADAGVPHSPSGAALGCDDELRPAARRRARGQLLGRRRGEARGRRSGSSADGLGGHAVLNDPDADRALAKDAAARKASATKAEVETARAGLDWRGRCSPLTAVCIASASLAASVSPKTRRTPTRRASPSLRRVSTTLWAEKESLTDVRKRMEAQAAAPSRIVPRGKARRTTRPSKRLESCPSSRTRLLLPQLPGGKETNLQYSMRLDAQRKSAAPVLPIGEHEEMSGDAERPADYREAAARGGATGSRVVLGRPPCALLPKGRHEGAKEFAARLAAAAQCSVSFPAGRGGAPTTRRRGTRRRPKRPLAAVAVRPRPRGPRRLPRAPRRRLRAGARPEDARHRRSAQSGRAAAVGDWLDEGPVAFGRRRGVGVDEREEPRQHARQGGAAALVVRADREGVGGAARQAALADCRGGAKG